MRCVTCGARRVAELADASDAVPACDACGGPMFVVGRKRNAAPSAARVTDG